MCGRFTQTKSRQEVLEALEGIELPPLFHGRYNVAPTQTVAVIRPDQPARAVESIWGFANPRSGALIINARSETLVERPMFKDLLAGNRCLIPADGFYEWKGRQPYYYQLPDQVLFAFAGLWRDDRCVIITRAADENMQGIHDRMPVIIPLDRRNQWLKPEENVASKQTIVRLDATLKLTMHPVSRRLNSVIHDDPACLGTPLIQDELF